MMLHDINNRGLCFCVGFRLIGFRQAFSNDHSHHCNQYSQEKRYPPCPLHNRLMGKQRKNCNTNQAAEQDAGNRPHKGNDCGQGAILLV